MSKQTKKFTKANDELDVAPKKLKGVYPRLERIEERLASLEVRRKRDPGSCRYLNERELALRLNVSVKHLQKLRQTGGGIPFYKIGCAIRYRLRDIYAYERAARRTSTSDMGNKGTNNG